MDYTPALDGGKAFRIKGPKDDIGHKFFYAPNKG